jgi:hypothetical protein
MIGVESHKIEMAQTVADYVSSDEELLQTFLKFDVSNLSFDPSPHNFYCSWVRSIMGTAFYNRWNTIRQKTARSYELPRTEDWATISALAHELLSSEK